MKVLVADGNRHLRATGYGGLSRAILLALKRHTGIALFVEPRRVPWDDGIAERDELLDIPETAAPDGMDAVLRIGTPQGRNRFGVPTLVYTQNALGDLPADWIASLSEADAVIVPGEFDAVVFRRHVKRVFTCPQFVSPSLFKPVPAYRAEGPDRLSFLFVGSYSYRKGVDLLVPAFADAFADGPPVHLRLHCFSGLENEGVSHLLGQARRLPSNVELSAFMGSVTPPWMARHINRHDAVVTFSRGEGWCMPLHEGLLCGKPVIAPDSTAMGEALPSAGVRRVAVRERLIRAAEDPFGAGMRKTYGQGDAVCYEVDAQDAAAALRDVAARYEDYRAAAMAGRQAILETFTLERIARDIGAALREVLGDVLGDAPEAGADVPTGAAAGAGAAVPAEPDGPPFIELHSSGAWAAKPAGTLPAGRGLTVVCRLRPAGPPVDCEVQILVGRNPPEGSFFWATLHHGLLDRPKTVSVPLARFGKVGDPDADAGSCVHLRMRSLGGAGGVSVSFRHETKPESGSGGVIHAKKRTPRRDRGKS